MIRVFFANSIGVPLCGDSSGQAPLLEFPFTSGTQETRSSLVAALYTALAEQKTVTFLVSTSACSSDGLPVITGMHIDG
jgi:hypothetical protein